LFPHSREAETGFWIPSMSTVMKARSACDGYYDDYCLGPDPGLDSVCYSMALITIISVMKLQCNIDNE
jgi:hypothetical protein